MKAGVGAGAGELDISGSAGLPLASPLLLFSLWTALLAGSPLATVEPEVSLFTSPLKEVVKIPGVRHDGKPHPIPVKLLTSKDLRSHRRQGLPERSSARKPAFIAP